MKKILIITTTLLMLLSSVVTAKIITLEWNSHPQASLITGFKLYKRKSNAVYNYNSPATYTFVAGGETEMTLNVSGPYMFVLRAYVEGSDCDNFPDCESCPCYSEDSNEVIYAIKASIRRHFMRK